MSAPRPRPWLAPVQPHVEGVNALEVLDGFVVLDCLAVLDGLVVLDCLAVLDGCVVVHRLAVLFVVVYPTKPAMT